MKHPFIKEKNKKRESLSSFERAVTCKSPLGINEDSLSLSENLWNDSGVLTTREGFACCQNGTLIDDSFACKNNKIFYSDFSLPDGSTLMALVREESVGITTVNFYACKDFGGTSFLFYIELVAPNGNEFIDIVNLLFIKHSAIKGSGIYIIIPTVNTHLRTGVVTKTVRYYEIKENFDGAYICDPTNFYSPLILKCGRGSSYITPEQFPLDDPSEPEGVNILGGNFEADFTCDDRSSQFVLPVSIDPLSYVRIHFYTSSISYREFFIRADSTVSNTVTVGSHDIYFKVNRSMGAVTAYSGETPLALTRYTSPNGLRIWAYTDTSELAFSLFNKRTKPVYFDKRIFIAGGNGYEDRVFFSGQNQPLYFSLKNSFVLGNDSSSITALSMQNRYVIAFKEREIYRITLQESSVPDKDTLRDDSAITSVPTPKHTIVRITNTVGCDRPLSIVTCGNRLVWYHSELGVYTLFGSNLYTEGSVYLLSGEISDRLMALTDEQTADIFAVLYKGYYMLISKNEIFIMNTLVSGFHFLSGHKSADKKYGGLSWFIWTPPESAFILSAYNRKGNSYFVMCDRIFRNYYISSLCADKDICGCENNIAQSEIPFSLRSAMLGGDNRRIKEAVIRAKFSNKGKITLFDRDKNLCSFDIKGKNSFCRYVIPLSCKTDKIGISISGEGYFALDEILINTTERNY